MRISSFQHQGRSSYGVVADDGLIDVGRHLGDRFPTLRSVLANDALAEVSRAADGRSPDVGLDAIRFLPVIPDPGKILCAGLNYEKHRLELDMPQFDHPPFFIRFADTQLGHGEPILKPKVSDAVDFEGELALVIGRAARNVAEADALSYVAGYSCYDDVSIRDWQFHTSLMTSGKNFPATGPFGPWLVTTDEIPDPAALELTTRLNGEVVQNSPVSDLIFSVPVLLAYITTFTSLEPGDVVLTGTPGGVGFRREPPLFMKAGDVIEVEISGIGTLSNSVVNE
jgi:2-keto-4-pentenoate hydratase/2-oxohepta-3-ene-1,7-dioic acid hydratase in catechol pathway